jgi:hypothetical protein
MRGTSLAVKAGSAEESQATNRDVTIIDPRIRMNKLTRFITTSPGGYFSNTVK